MNTIRSLSRFSIVLFILGIYSCLFAILEIVNLWTDESIRIFSFQLTDSGGFSLSDKVVFTVYQILNISMIVPVYWFYSIAKSLSKGVFFESFVIKKFQQTGNYLYAVAAIAVLFPRFFSYDTSISGYLWYGVHPVFVMIFATLLLSFVVILKEARKQKQENDLTI